MNDVAPEPSSIHRWQRRLLPGELVQAPGARRSPRDWLVDSALFALAFAGGLATLVQTWDDHGTFLLVVDVAAGSAACLALWFRRRYPVGVGTLAVVAGGFSALGAVAAPLAVFGVAVRGSRRALIGVAVLAVAAIASFHVLYPSTGAFVPQMITDLLVLLVATAEVYMSVATVKAYVSRLLTKLEVENRVQIALLVQEAQR